MLGGCRVLDASGELGWLGGRLLADLGADVVKLEPPGAVRADFAWQAYNVNKRVVALDLGSAAGQTSLERLLALADILIESSAPDAPERALFAPDEVHARHPRLVHVSVTPFGHCGPRAHWQGSDLEIMAASGAMSLAGEPGGKPLRITAPQARAWAGSHAAAGALLALLQREATGRGQHVDVSAQASVLAALAHAPTFVDLGEPSPTRCGAFITGRAITGARFRAFWPCRDGYINFVLYGGAAGRRSNEQLVAWMRETGAELGVLATMDFARYDVKRLTQAEVDAIEAPVATFFLTLSKREFLEGASTREMLGYPVSTMADIAHDPQLAAREFWADVPDGAGRSMRHCGPFARIDGQRARLRYAPGSLVGVDALLREWTPARSVQPARERAVAV